MFKLESNRLKREFKVNNGSFFASQILNKYSNMSFVPDGNGCEFVVHFVDGTEFSSKGLGVVNSIENGSKLMFVFEENCGVSVAVEYWVHDDSNTICKQLTLRQRSDVAIDYVLLEDVGIINSKTHFSVDVMPEGNELSGYHSALGQPFYIDSLFFGCEFPATDNKIIHGAGQIKYYIGGCVGENFSCPVTVIGGAKDNTFLEVQKAFFKYIDFISKPAPLRFQYNCWYDHMLKIDENIINDSFSEISKGLAFHSAPKLDAYVVDDGWNDYRAKFWCFDKKTFPNGLTPASEKCREMGSTLGMWLGPRGGYSKAKKFAKKIQKAGNGYFNKNANDICIASETYVNKVTDFLIDCVEKYDLSYLKLDGFCLSPCQDASHDHAVGGENDMYYMTQLWHRWITAFSKIRASRKVNNRDLWINMTCYVNVSPWWLQWVNSLWVQNSNDIGFCDNVDSQRQVEAEITYRDTRYYDLLCTRCAQIPLYRLYNHEPIYGHTAKVDYTDEEFEKYIMWHTVRGQALNELHLSYDMMSDKKWDYLARAMNFQKDNWNILKNVAFIGGNPEENNIYGYVGWSEEGEGIIALRNPTDESAPLTLNINKLMGAPEDLKDVRRINVYCRSIPQTDELYSYKSKIDLTLHPFEVIIFKFIK